MTVCETGEPTQQSFIPADLVVINADLPYASKCLLRGADTSTMDPIFDWDDSFSFSSGVISFHWAVDKELSVLNTHNVFLVASSRDGAKASWKVLRTNQADEDSTLFNFYVHRASRSDPTAAPKGCDSIMVLVPCKTLLRDPLLAHLPREEALRKYKEQFPEELVSEIRRAVLKRMAVIDSLNDLEKHILNEVVDTPATWANQFNLAAGTPFALVRPFDLSEQLILLVFFFPSLYFF